MKICVINGVNLNNLGSRDSVVYGKKTLKEINDGLVVGFPKVEFSFFTSNIEGEIVNCIQQSKNFDGIAINAGAYTHYSYAIADAIKDSLLPVVEVHLSNVFAREGFRSVSVLSPVCVGSISGFGEDSYRLAVEALVKLVNVGKGDCK